VTRQTMQWVNESIVKRLLFYFKKSLFPFSYIIFSSSYLKETLTCVLYIDLLAMYIKLHVRSISVISH
jgi:hypothetical protein